MSETRRIIDTLWNESRVRLPDPMNSETMAYLDKTREKLLDILIVMDPPFKAEQVGFITLKNQYKGVYQIWATPDMHPLIPTQENVGIAVREPYQFRNFGRALISLGLGVAQKESEANGHSNFLVFGRQPTESAIKLYESTGFRINYLEGRGETYVDHDNPNHIPEITISAIKTLRQKRALLKSIRGLWNKK